MSSEGTPPSTTLDGNNPEGSLQTTVAELVRVEGVDNEETGNNDTAVPDSYMEVSDEEEGTFIGSYMEVSDEEDDDALTVEQIREYLGNLDPPRPQPEIYRRLRIKESLERTPSANEEPDSVGESIRRICLGVGLPDIPADQLAKQLKNERFFAKFLKKVYLALREGNGKNSVQVEAMREVLRVRWSDERLKTLVRWIE
ncbi:hypothetical protein ED733_006335 [Metarhizium rileyi]|uniref:Uncharacterized protein n=1 Tax=Metarhizium rileyi (strain RCEF 4871) TaxID=1649241 RepID=A0A5C6GAN3_METRR|nr:hypothetical protein ED733_006335 [Metarhizium rileyi]